MGDKFLLVEEKALEDNIIVSGFFGEDYSDHYSNQSLGFDWNTTVDESDSTESSLASPERAVYWESQEILLQEILVHQNSSGSKLRKEIGRLIEIARERSFCECPIKLNSDACAKCLRQKVVNLLGNEGFNATLFTSKWKSTHKYPGGKHEYIKVIASTQGRKKQIPILIELEFRDEFKMVKACEEYNKLIEQLPEIYIGKPDHLNAIVRVVCEAAKRSAAEKKIHMGPWRKRSFMLMKWSSSQERESLSDESSSNISLITSRPEMHIPTISSCFQFSAATAVRVT